MAVIELTKENFQQTVTENPFVMIDFWAPWCGPCKSFAPIYDSVSAKHEDVVFAKVNTEDEQELAAHFQVRSIPTLMIFRDNIIIYSEAGMLQEPQLEQLLTQAKGLDMDDVRRQIAEGEAEAEGKA